MVRAALAVVTVVVLMLLSLAVPPLGNPISILLVTAVTLGLTLVKDRRMAITLTVAASFALMALAWVLSQPTYVLTG